MTVADVCTRCIDFGSEFVHIKRHCEMVYLALSFCSSLNWLLMFQKVVEERSVKHVEQNGNTGCCVVASITVFSRTCVNDVYS